MLRNVALHRLQLSAYIEVNGCSKHQDFFDKIGKIQQLYNDAKMDADIICEEWKKCKALAVNFMASMQEYKDARSEQSEQFRYWNTFLDIIFPILRDLTRSHREGNWQLHISAIRRALPLFFAFSRTNYSRWVPLYYEDCIKLEETFPAIHASFIKGGFVVKHTLRRGSGVPMDQALEKEYNKPAKGKGGIIGITRQKETVAKWNIIKHEKSQYTKYVRELCCINENDEYSYHHKFAQTKTETDDACVEFVYNYISQRTNPFDISSTCKVTNIVTGKQIEHVLSHFLINCITEGEKGYNEFKLSRLENKTKNFLIPYRRHIKLQRKFLLQALKLMLRKKLL
jgi:hypothetical protein